MKGTLYIGGKMDDVTILVAQAVPSQVQRSSPGGADASAASFVPASEASLIPTTLDQRCDNLGLTNEIFWGSAGEIVNTTV